MRTKVALWLSRFNKITRSTAFLICCLTPPAAAQTDDAAAAFGTLVRETKKLLLSKPLKRRKVAASARIPIPPPPVRSPVRVAVSVDQRQRTAVKTTHLAPISASKSAATKPPAPIPPVPPARAAVKTDTTGEETETAKALAPPPDIWNEAEIAAARRVCKKILASIDAVTEPVEPIKEGPCGDPAPMKLRALKGKETVNFRPAPTLNCPMVLALDTWIRRGLQPLALKHLGSPITSLSVMSSYSCRNAYRRKSTRLSEHGKANALDIGGFHTANGVRAQLIAHWGPTDRDMIAAAEKVKDKPQAIAVEGQTQTGRQQPRTPVKSNAIGPTRPLQTKEIATDPVARQNIAPAAPSSERSGEGQFESAEARASNPTSFSPPLPERRPSLRQRLQWSKAERKQQALTQSNNQRKDYSRKLNNFLSLRSDLGGPKQKSETDVKTAPVVKNAGVDRAAFLRGAHRTACRIFGTVLGPEANDAHRNHFHIDLAHRRHKNYCR